MKKKILSLLLVMAMLLSIVPMAGAAGEAAEPKFNGYNLYLQNDIAICFEANRAAIEEGFEKVEFYIDGELVQTRTTLPEADANGNVSFRCTKLTPAQMGETVTAKLYIGGEVKHEFSTSIKDYCMTILRNESNTEAWKNAELRTMLVDLLNYGAATQTFAEATTPLVNADLGEYAALATTGNLSLTNACSLFEYTDVTAPAVTWYGVGLNLKDSVTLRYEFVAESVEGLAIHFFNDGYTLDAWVTDFEKVAGTEDHYYAYFGMLNPAQLSETVSAVAYSAYNTEDTVRASHKLMYSAESYAYAVANGTGFSAELEALTDAMMRYGNAVRCWINGHMYVNGKCESCDKEKVFEMTTDTITIQAEETVLTPKLNGNTAVTVSNNTNATGEKIVYTTGNYSGKTYDGVYTVADSAGEIIVYVIPAVSGTYSINAKVLYKGVGATGFLIEDDTTTAASTYTRRPWDVVSEGTITNSYNNSADFKTWEMGTYTWTAGKVYAIRLLAASSSIAYDEFVISKVDLHEHSFAQTWSSDDTNHWHECECGEKADKAEHTFTYGVCECGKEKVFKMTGTSIEIEAEDAILTEYNSALIILDNESASGKKIVKTYGKYNSTYYKAATAETHAGNLIVKFVPEVDGTYYVYARALVKGALGAMVVHVDDTATKYTRTAVSTASVVDNSNKLEGWSAATDFKWGAISNQDSINPIGIEMKAGETYVIRILGSSANMAFDKFIITTDSTIPTDPAA